MKKYIQSAILDISEEPTVTRRDIAKDTDDIAILDKLASDKDEYVRRFVSANPNATADILRKVNDNTSYNEDVVNKNIALNPNTPVDVLKELMSYGDYLVQEQVVKNPNATPELIELYNSDYESINAEVLSFARELLSDIIDDYFTELYEKIETAVPRYKKEWWTGETNYDGEEFICDKYHKNTNATPFEDVISDMLFRGRES